MKDIRIETPYLFKVFAAELAAVRKVVGRLAREVRLRQVDLGGRHEEYCARRRAARLAHEALTRAVEADVPDDLDYVAGVRAATAAADSAYEAECEAWQERQQARERLRRAKDELCAGGKAQLRPLPLFDRPQAPSEDGGGEVRTE